MFNSFEEPQYVKFTCTKSEMKGPTEKIGRGYGLQPEPFRGEIEHTVINKSIFADSGIIWEPYLRLDVLCLAFIFAIHSVEMQKNEWFCY